MSWLKVIAKITIHSVERPSKIYLQMPFYIYSNKIHAFKVWLSCTNNFRSTVVKIIHSDANIREKQTFSS